MASDAQPYGDEAYREGPCPWDRTATGKACSVIGAVTRHSEFDRPPGAGRAGGGAYGSALVRERGRAVGRDLIAERGPGVGVNRESLEEVGADRHQIDQCAALAEELRDSSEPSRALRQWISAFVEFLVTKHGLGAALQADDAGFHGLHSLMLDRLVPACGLLVEAAVAADELDPTVTAYVLMRAVGNLCMLGPGYEREDARAMVVRLLAGCSLAD